MIFQKQLAWLVTLSHNPGWKPYAWKRAQALELDPSGLFVGITAALVQAMRAAAGEAGREG